MGVHITYECEIMGCCGSKNKIGRAKIKDYRSLVVVNKEEDNAYEKAIIKLAKGHVYDECSEFAVYPIQFQYGQCGTPGDGDCDVGNGYTYKGDFQGQLMHGKGSLTFPHNQGKYFGGFEDGVINGVGSYTDMNGYLLVAHFASNAANGFGILLSADKNMYYIGEFKDNLFDGVGTLFDGWSFYRGSFKEGYYDGEGLLISFDDHGSPLAYYQGAWMAGQKCGYGRCVWLDGRTYSGYWENSQLNGPGVFYYKNGDCYMGIYENDKKHGYGQFTWNSLNKQYTGGFHEGFQHGDAVFQSPSGERRYGIYEMGTLKEWNEAGDMESVIQQVEILDYGSPSNDEDAAVFETDLKYQNDERFSEVAEMAKGLGVSI